MVGCMEMLQAFFVLFLNVVVVIVTRYHFPRIPFHRSVPWMGASPHSVFSRPCAMDVLRGLYQDLLCILGCSLARHLSDPFLVRIAGCTAGGNSPLTKGAGVLQTRARLDVVGGAIYAGAGQRSGSGVGSSTLRTMLGAGEGHGGGGEGGVEHWRIGAVKERKGSSGGFSPPLVPRNLGLRLTGRMSGEKPSRVRAARRSVLSELARAGRSNVSMRDCWNWSDVLSTGAIAAFPAGTDVPVASVPAVVARASFGLSRFVLVLALLLPFSSSPPLSQWLCQLLFSS